jgi:hypothetical protein
MDKLWAGVPHTKTRKIVDVSTWLETFNLLVVTERVNL